MTKGFMALFIGHDKNFQNYFVYFNSKKFGKVINYTATL